jgi:hypothetical protein
VAVVDVSITHASFLNYQGFPTSVLMFGSNLNSLSTRTINHFVRGYNVIEKIQMIEFFL